MNAVWELISINVAISQIVGYDIEEQTKRRINGMIYDSSKSGKFREAYQEFYYNDGSRAMDSATATGYPYYVELFEDGKYITSYKSEGYKIECSKDCLTLQIPSLTDDDWYEDGTRCYADRAEEMRQSFKLACTEYNNRPE